MSFRVPYLQHGRRRHRAKGSDPVYDTDPLEFDKDNEGGWLYVVANDSTDVSYGTLGVLIAETTGDGLELVSIDGEGPPQTSVLLTSSSLEVSADVGGTAVTFVLGASQVEMTIGGTPVFRIGVDGNLHIKTGASVVADL